MRLQDEQCMNALLEIVHAACCMLHARAWMEHGLDMDLVNN